MRACGGVEGSRLVRFAAGFALGQLGGSETPPRTARSRLGYSVYNSGGEHVSTRTTRSHGHTRTGTPCVATRSTRSGCAHRDNSLTMTDEKDVAPLLPFAPMTGLRPPPRTMHATATHHCTALRKAHAESCDHVAAPCTTCNACANSELTRTREYRRTSANSRRDAPSRDPNCA